MKSGEIAFLTSSLSSEGQHRSTLLTSSQHFGKSRRHEPCSLSGGNDFDKPYAKSQETKPQGMASADLALPRVGSVLSCSRLESEKGLLGVQGFSESLRSSPQQEGTEKGHTCKWTDNQFEGNGPAEACELWSGHAAPYCTSQGVWGDPPEFPWRPWQPESPGCCSGLGPGMQRCIPAGGQGAREGSVHSLGNISRYLLCASLSSVARMKAPQPEGA